MSSSTPFETSAPIDVQDGNVSFVLTDKEATRHGRAYHNIETGQYILPCDDSEKKRLDLQHNLLKQIFDGLISPAVKQNLVPGSRVLDIACGTGIWLLEMAKAYPDSTFVGIDIANVFPKENVPPNVEFKIMSALDLSRFNENSFEFVHTRLLIAGFTEENWLSMIKSMYRIVSPGGLVQFMEYNIMAPSTHSSICKTNLALYFAMKEKNNDCFISQKLGCFLVHNGFDVFFEDRRRIDLGANDQALSKMAVQNWVDALYGFRPFLLPFLCPENPDRFQSIIDTYINDCIKSNWYKEAMVVVGIKPIGA